MHKLKVFIAGSKVLVSERTIVRNVLMQFQTRWNIMVEAKSFEDFSYSLVNGGRQNDYNIYITDEADLVIFVIASKVGNITMAEFMLGYSTFIKNGRPDILVFVEQNRANIAEVEILKQTMTNLNQYYIEYDSLEDLNKLLSEELTKFIAEHQELLEQYQMNPSIEKKEPWLKATLNECAYHAMQLGLHMFYLHLACLSHKESEKAQMQIAILDDLKFWGIDRYVLSDDVAEADYCLDALREKSAEFGQIAFFCYNYLVLAYGYLAGQNRAVSDIYAKCEKLSREVVVPPFIMEMLPPKDDINAFSRCIFVLNNFYSNYIDNVIECSSCGARLAKGTPKCQYCGKELSR